MLIKHNKLQPLQCYHIFSDSRDVYLSKNCYEHYSPRMVPVAGNSGSGSWPTLSICVKGSKMWNALTSDIKLSIQENCDSFSFRELQVLKCRAVFMFMLNLFLIKNI